jgi:hypothetical protein
VFSTEIYVRLGGWYVLSPDQEGNKLQRPNSVFIQHTHHEAQYTSSPVAITFVSHSKRNSEYCPSNQVSVATNDRRVGRKWWNFKYFSFQGTGGSPTEADQGKRVGYQDIGSPGRPVSCGLQVTGEQEHCCTRTRLTWWTSRFVGVLSIKISFNYTIKDE